MHNGLAGIFLAELSYKDKESSACCINPWLSQVFMKTIHFLTISLVIVWFVQSSLACTLLVAPLSKFDKEEFIFIGKVTGYTSEVSSLGSARANSFKAYGLTVKVKESIFLPETPLSDFEVFPIALFGDCSLGGSTLNELKKEFPAGTEVRVIAKRATLFSQPVDANIIRLEDHPNNLGSISINTDEKGWSITSAVSVYDYTTFDFEKDREVPVKYSLDSFEARKDLLRLRNASTQAERNLILERLLSVPFVDDLDLYTVLKNYAVNDAEADRYYEANLKTFDPKFYSQYMAVKNARLELLKRGYTREEVEEALKKAMGDGPGFTVEAIVRTALKYLPKKQSTHKR